MDIEERRHPLTDEDVDRIAAAVACKTRAAFHIEEEVHYNSHKKIDKLLEAYDAATNTFTKTFFALIIVGAIFLAGLGLVKGVK